MIINYSNIKYIPQYGRHDSGSVETGAEFATAMAELKIACLPTTPPGVPEKSIERVVQTHKADIIAAILSASPTLITRDWDIASQHACTLKSTMVNPASKSHGDGSNKSPYELVMGTPPRLEVFQEFGLGNVGVTKKSGV
jgi:hypothetical protein